ncbi:MAG: sigma-70 family RNA polymerase sigma factor, partial [Alphaproteobacteria bacterium]|nr:sigma-70 family RNA polymerase sigma factor [Alphaproteobacteria bacterium]
ISMATGQWLTGNYRRGAKPLGPAFAVSQTAWMSAGEHTRGDRADDTASLSDDVLVARLADGNKEAWNEITRRHLSALVGYAWHMLRDQAEAEDVAQETMVRLMRKAETWEPGGAKVKTWLFRVAINQCIDRQRARRTTSLDVVAEQADPNTAGATVARDHALRRTVGGAVDGLPTRQKQALTLVYYQGFSQQEAAEALAVSVDAVESLLARARRTLKTQLKDLAGDLLEEW